MQSCLRSCMTAVSYVTQIIDTDKATLENVITFPPDGALVIQSSIQISGNQRVTFEFTEANLKLPRRDFKLPPYGKGWSVPLIHSS